MKILNIEELKKTDGSSYWEVTIPKKDGTPSGSPLIEWTKPTYNTGDELPFEVELMKPAKERWYYKRRGGATSQGGPTRESKPSSTSSSEKKDDAILQAVAFKGAIELEKHHYIPEGKVDTDRVLRITRALFDGLKTMLNFNN